MTYDRSLTKWPRALEWTLRIGAFLCFVGHGVFGVMTKEGWVRYFRVVGIGRATAFTLAASLLVRRGAALVVFIAAWKLVTESLFLTAGAPVWEVVERGGSYAAPIALALVVLMSRGRAVAHDPIAPHLVRR